MECASVYGNGDDRDLRQIRTVFGKLVFHTHTFFPATWFASHVVCCNSSPVVEHLLYEMKSNLLAHTVRHEGMGSLFK